MHFHWQNLNEDRRGKVKGWPYHGRAWLGLGKLNIRFEWNLWSSLVGLYVTACQAEAGTSFCFAVPPFYLCLSFAHDSWRNRHKDAREISVRIFDSAIWWRFWTNPNEWSNQTPKWRDGRWRVLDTLLGKERYSRRTLSTHPVRIPMPEGAYAATVVLCEDSWKRARWPFAKRLERCSINVPEGIPHQGKGENSWDCGEDRLYNLGCLGSTVEEAIAKTVQTALKSRRRYDGDVMATYPAPSGALTGGRTNGVHAE